VVRKFVSKLVLTGFLALAALVGSAAVAKETAPGAYASTIALAQLPVQGRETYQRIRDGGPFAYDKDGMVFGNRERLLPAEKRGYYREYTVKTPGAKNRGTRRIVCGGAATTPDACFYTADHYASFRKIVP